MSCLTSGKIGRWGDFTEEVLQVPPTGQRVAGDAMDSGVTEIQNKRAEQLVGK